MTITEGFMYLVIKLLTSAITVQLLTDANSYERKSVQQRNLEANKDIDRSKVNTIHSPLPKTTGTFPGRVNPPSQSPSNNITNSTEVTQAPVTKSTDVETPSNKGSNKWVFFVSIPVAGLLVCGLVCTVLVWKNKGVATIRPWRTGLSGPLQQAFITGND